MKLNINNETIAVRVVAFAEKSDELCLNRAQLILDIFKEVNKRKTPEAQWAYLMKDVAEPLANHYKCEAKYTKTGSITFYDGDDRHETANSRFRALVASTGLVSGSGNTNKSKAQKKDPVVEALAKFKALTAAQKKRFLASI